jgi:peptide/nickel transport system permease protein
MKAAGFAAVALLLIHVAALLGPAISSFDPFTQDRSSAFAPPNATHWLGTDALGRDQWARIVDGMRYSLFTGMAASGTALAIALAAGGLAGFYGSWLDNLLMTGSELFLSLPWFYLVLGVRAFLPLTISSWHSVLIVALILAGTGWPRPARLIRGIALTARNRDYVHAAQAFGGSSWYLIRRHILPETYSAAAVQAVLLIPRFILVEVTLSFFGLGISEPAPSLGNMLSSLRDPIVMTGYPWMWAPFGILVIIVLCYQTIADCLQTLN